MTTSTPKTSEPIHDIQSRVRRDAEAEGFDVVGFVSTETPPQQQRDLAAFIKNGFMGDMLWMAETQDRRASPRAMWPQAKTAIVMALNYAPDHDPMQNLLDVDSGNISVYARADDYHKIIKGRLKQIASRIAAREHVDVKVFVDTAPLMEKPLAARAGLGWQGKHTNLVSRSFGSWLFLGVILVDEDWHGTSEQEPQDHCGSCTKCLEICPTDAFPRAYELDARRCISYLTIEHKGMIPLEFRAAMGNRIFGCDDCLAVCPWNSFASEARDIRLKVSAEMSLPDLGELLALDESGFKQKFSRTPVRRAGYERFMRNVIIAVGNSGNADYVEALMECLDSPYELVKATSIWALSRLMSAAEFNQIKAQYRSDEDTKTIAQEWGEA